MATRLSIKFTGICGCDKAECVRVDEDCKQVFPGWDCPEGKKVIPSWNCPEGKKVVHGTVGPCLIGLIGTEDFSPLSQDNL